MTMWNHRCWMAGLCLSAVLPALAAAQLPFAESPVFDVDTRFQASSPVFSESTDFGLDARIISHPISSSDSNAFAGDTRGAKRAWADSPEFTLSIGPGPVRPQVISQSPAPGSIGNPSLPQIEARFDRDLRSQSVNIASVVLRTAGGSGAHCDVQVSYGAGTRAIVVVPTATLMPGSTYEVVLASLIQGTDGTAISPTSWSFTTQVSSDRDRVIAAMIAFRDASQSTLVWHRDTAALNIQTGLQAIWGDFWFGVTRDVVDFITGLATDRVVKAGPGSKLSNQLRSVYANYIKPFQTGQSIRQPIDYMTGFLERSKMLRDLGVDAGGHYRLGSPSLEEVRNAVNSSLWVHDGLSVARPTYHGVSAALTDFGTQADAIIAAVPADITPENADAAVAFLERQRAMLRESKGHEVCPAIWRQTSSGKESIPVVLGQSMTVSPQLQGGIDALLNVEDAKIALTVSKLGFAVIKVAGAAGVLSGAGTVLGLGVVSWADAVPWGVSIIETGVDLAGSLDVVLTPNEVIANAIQQSADLLANDVLGEREFLVYSLQHATELAAPSGGSMSLRAGKTAVFAATGSPTATTSGVSFVGEPVVPDVNLDLGPTAQASIGIRNDSTGVVQCRIIATIYAPGTTGDSSIIGYAGPLVPIVLQSGTEQTVSFPFTAPRSLLFGREGYLMRLEADVMQEDTGLVEHLGPVEARFRSGPAAELAGLAGLGETPVGSDILSVGQERLFWVFVPEGLQSVQWRLAHDQAIKADLHLYDASDRHAGVDYETGALELLVPGTSHGGQAVYPQVIQMTSPQTGTYKVRVVCREGGGNVALMTVGASPFPALVLASNSLAISLHPGEIGSIETAIITVGSSEGVGSLQPSNTALSGDGGTLNGDIVSFGLSSPTLGAGGGESFVVTINVPQDVDLGHYTGTVQVIGTSSTSGQPLSATAQLNLSVVAVSADFNQDKDVDADDMAQFIACATGPMVQFNPDSLPAGCTLPVDEQGRVAADFDKDGDVDQEDFAVLQRCWSGEEAQPDPHCAN